MNAYEQKLECRRQRLEAAAERAEAEANAHQKASERMLAVIPLGQPILIGHHSEAADRRYRARAYRQMEKSAELSAKAKQLARRAQSVGEGGVSSDDPDAVAKLQSQLEKLEEKQAKLVAANKLVRKNDRAGLAAMGLSESTIAGLFEPDFSGRIGVSDYVLKNNSANIRRIKARIAELQKPKVARAPIVGDGFRVVEDSELNRVAIEFDSRPSAEQIAKLKANGFHWSPNRGAWLRMLNNAGWYAAECVVRGA